MKYRKLRIAWSVGWAILGLLLIALCVRSYWWHDTKLWSTTLCIGSNAGTIYWSQSYIETFLTPSSVPPPAYRTFPARPPKTRFIHFSRFTPAGLTPGWTPRHQTELHIAIWLPIAVAIFAAVLPWASWRFSLRTLLIGITAVAAILGLAIVAMRES
jgi:hypothetical protein